MGVGDGRGAGEGSEEGEEERLDEVHFVVAVVGGGRVELVE